MLFARNITGKCCWVQSLQRALDHGFLCYLKKQMYWYKVSQGQIFPSCTAFRIREKVSTVLLVCALPLLRHSKKVFFKSTCDCDLWLPGPIWEPKWELSTYKYQAWQQSVPQLTQMMTQLMRKHWDCPSHHSLQRSFGRGPSWVLMSFLAW